MLACYDLCGVLLFYSRIYRVVDKKNFLLRIAYTVCIAQNLHETSTVVLTVDESGGLPHILDQLKGHIRHVLINTRLESMLKSVRLFL